MSCNYYSYPKGNRLFLSDYYRYELKLVKLNDLFNNKSYSLNIPDFQRNLNLSIVNKLESIFINDFDYLISISNPIQLATLPLDKNLLFVLDGQHRLTAFENIIKNYSEFKTKEVFVTIINCNNIAEMEKIYYDINIDKSLNTLNKFNNVEINEIIIHQCYFQLKKRLFNIYGKSFDGRNNLVYKFEDFMSILASCKFIEIIYNNFNNLSKEELIDKCIDIINEENLNVYLKVKDQLNTRSLIIKNCYELKKIISIKELNFINHLIEIIQFS